MIATQTLTEFPVFSDNGTNTPPGDAKYSEGFNPAETLPAVWLNYFLNRASSGVTNLNAGAASMEKELNSVLTEAGITPDVSQDNQVTQALKIIIGNVSHPVGSLYWSSKDTDPSTLFGGTWTQIKDKFILAAGDTYTSGATGGAATVTLTEANLPAHTHTCSTENTDHTHSGTTGGMSQNSTGTVYLHDGGAGLPETTGASGNLSVDTTTHAWCEAIGSTGSALLNIKCNVEHAHSVSTGWQSEHYSNYQHSHTIGSTGSGTAVNILPPYAVKYCWERTA